MKRVISTDKAPKAIGPYSQAIAVAPKELVFCSGQIALDPATGNVVDGGIEPQTARGLANIEAALGAAGRSCAARAPAAGSVVDGGVEPQTARVLANIEAVLGAAGCSFADVVKTTIFLADM